MGLPRAYDADEGDESATGSASDGGLGRREFVKAAVAIGGASALSACLDRFGSPSVATGVENPGSLPERQHAWDDVLSRDDHGNVVPPRHHLLLLLDYPSDGTPAASDRETVAGALDDLERAYARGNDGLVFTVGYSPAYFERFDESLPDSVDLPAPRALSSFEDPDLDTPDALVHLASDHGSVVLAAEEALFGAGEANGVSVRSVADVFERVDRRTGFIGEGLPAKNQDVDGIPDSKPVPEEAPMFMGYKTGFEKNQATEDRVTIDSGPFAGGTTQHASKLHLRLEDWYGEQDEDDRVAEIFCPVHAAEGRVEGVGENLGDDNGVGEDCVENVEAHAREYGRVGHAQKAARTREDGRPVILRRDFDSTDGGRAGVHFVSLQRGIGDFVKTREAMNGSDLTDAPAVSQRVNNGILEYIFVKHRGNYLLPPRPLRALPPADPSA
ncbi:Tat pathway signal protein [Halobium salinum]|uniref:Tat pathway signal protein n=1 Tax=Halobium salinum TaxID=1364940 RepID=A0ABD5PCJ5_9EURY|nr:Tat pathway signal protein [Halobium salinum]